MRKLDTRNKMSIVVMLIVAIILLILFSLFAKKILSNQEVSYSLNSGIIVFDQDKTKLSFENDVLVKKKWNDTYYIEDDDNEYVIGSHLVGYDSLLETIELYGTFYNVSSKGKVEKLTDYNQVDNMNTDKFYKLSDRHYLIIGKDITSSDSSLNTNNYLLIELDKTGNATLTNNKVNLKTISNTIINTKSFSFDIANEKLLIDDEEIDVKKVIGSTNSYEEKETESSDIIYNITNNNSSTTIINNTNNYSNNIVNNSSNIINNSTTNNSIQQGSTSNEELIELATKTSVISVTGHVNYIDGLYVIYDPLDEYKNVFIDVIDANGNLVTTYYLSKDNTDFAITNLNADSEYKLLFKYTYLETSNNTSYLTNDIFDVINIKTTKPSIKLAVDKVTKNKIYYTIKTDSSYLLDSANVSLYIDNELIGTNIVDVISASSSNGTSSSFTITNNGTYVELKIEDVKYNGLDVNVDTSYKYRNY